MKSISILVSLFILISFQLQAQEMPGISECQYPNETEFSRFSMENFLTGVNHIDKRIESGTENVKVNEIQVIIDETECLSLRNFILSNSKYKKVDEFPKLRKFFYKSDDFYFVFWKQKKLVLGGGRKLFLVIKKDFSKTYEFYK